MLGCNKDENISSSSPINLSDDFILCNTLLSECTDGNGAYCLFGFKWGRDSVFQEPGFNSRGPKSSGGLVTYSFQEENGLVNTHSQVNLPSKSFRNLPPCAKTEIRKALNAWSGIANIEFDELADNSDSQIKFYVADIVQRGLGSPNYPDGLCSDLSGNVIIKSFGIGDCNFLYVFALHEIGHVLGLGHVDSENVMNPNFSALNFNKLQMGDTLGILELYGEN